MTTENWLAYVVTVLVLMSTPGPSHLLMLSTSITHGFTRSLATAAGDLTANLLQMLAAGLGLVTVIFASERVFLAIKWLGVAYLVWLGLRMIRRSLNSVGPATPPRLSARRLWLRGFITSASNPKAIVFFAALLPLFIDPAAPFWRQFVVLSLTYLVIDGVFLCGYGLGANWLSARLRGHSRIWLDRIGGGLIISAAIVLGSRTLATSH